MKVIVTRAPHDATAGEQFYNVTLMKKKLLCTSDYRSKVGSLRVSWTYMLRRSKKNLTKICRK